MTIWNMIRSIISTTLMDWAVSVAPPEEKLSANQAMLEHLIRCIQRDRDARKSTLGKPPTERI